MRDEVAVLAELSFHETPSSPLSSLSILSGESRAHIGQSYETFTE